MNIIRHKEESALKDIKWGVLAPGNIANRFAKGLAEVKHAVPYAVGSRDLGRAKEYAEKYGFEKAYGSYEELAKDKEVDAIYVATPHPMHEQAVLTCLDHGKAVLCEKPFAVNARQAQNMISRARENKVFLMEAMWTRFLPAVQKAMELVKAGAIGRVRHISADFGFNSQVNPDSRLYDLKLAGGSLLDVGIYPLSFCSLVYGQQPDRIQSHLELGVTGVDEIATALLSYRGGRSAQVMSAIRLNTVQEAVITGDSGFIRLPEFWTARSVHLINAEGEQTFDLPFAASGFQFEIQEVVDCLNQGLIESPNMPLDETLALMRTMDEIRFANHLRYPFEEEENT